MNDVEVVQERHDMKTTTTTPRSPPTSIRWAKESSGFAKYLIIRRTMIAAMALLPIPFLVSLRDLWVTPPGVTTPSEELLVTLWKPACAWSPTSPTSPSRPTRSRSAARQRRPGRPPARRGGRGQPQRPGQGSGHRRAHDPRRDPVAAGRRLGLPGHPSRSPRSAPTSAARSRCTQQRTHELLCPCHQSTFNLSDSANVVFGPAARRMPQLPITVDDEGYRSR